MEEMLTDEERGKIMEMAGPAGAQVAGTIVKEVVDRIENLPLKGEKRDATLTLIACGIADHVEEFHDEM